MKTKFYQFIQNNSGGAFVNSEKDGICEYVIIEALNANDANNRAEDIGLYFDGCYNGIDCNCCGDRWYKVDESDGEDEPSIYGESVYDTEKSLYRDKCYIHFLDGKIEEVNFK